MKLSDQQIENVLRTAPKPKEPATLRADLAAQVRLAAARNTARTGVLSFGFGAWLRRWWPALAPASVSLACAAMMVSQEVEIRALRQNARHLAEQRASLQTAAVGTAD